MLRRILKYILWMLAVGAGGVVLLVSAVYWPPVQNFVKSKAVAYLSEQLGMQIAVERLRLRFPLRLAVDSAEAVTLAGDTLFRCETLRADVALWPLVCRQVVVRQFTFGNASFHWSDTLGGTDLAVRVRELALAADAVDLAGQTARLTKIRLRGGDVRLRLGSAADSTVTDTAAVPLLWKIAADRLQLDDLDFRLYADSSTRLFARIGTGRIDRAGVDLADLTVRAQRLRIAGGRFGYDRNPLPPAAGFDPDHIGIEDLRLTLDSVFNRRAEVRTMLSELAFAERSGLVVRHAAGKVAMDSAGYRVDDFRLQTAASELWADCAVGAAVDSLDAVAPVRVGLDAAVGADDLFRFLAADPSLRSRLCRRRLTVDLRLSGTLGAWRLERLALAVPRELDFTAQGYFRSVVEPERASGELVWEGRLRDPQLAAVFLPEGFALPPMRFRGEVRAGAGSYRGGFELLADGGKVQFDGSFTPRTRRYRAALRVDTLPLFRFRPADSLGCLTLAAQAEGQGFDPFDPATSAQADLQIGQAEYRQVDFRQIRLAVGLAGNRLSGRLTSDNAGLNADLRLTGLLTARRQEAAIEGSLGRVDFERLGLASRPLSAAMRVDLRGSATGEGAYAARLALDSAAIRYGAVEHRIVRTVVSAAADSVHVEAGMNSGDLQLQFRSEAGVDPLVAAFARTAAEVQRQIRAGEIDADTLGRLLPPFRLDFRAARNNGLNSWLQTRGIGFLRAGMAASVAPGRPFDLRAGVEGFSTRGIVLDTLSAGIDGRNGALSCFVRMANRPGNRNRFGEMALSGRAAGRTAQLTLAQRDSEGGQGLNFGLRAVLADSAVTVSLIPQRPVFGFAEWTVNEGNYVRYGFDRTIAADLRVARTGQSFVLQSAAAPDLPHGGIRFGLNGVDIGGVLRLLPVAPPVEGRLGADLTFGRTGRAWIARGGLTVDTLRYDGRRVGDIGLQWACRADTVAGQEGSLALTVDRRPALTAEGRYVPGDSVAALRLTADLPGVPLAAADPFLPAGSGSLTGWLRGHVEAEGGVDALRLSGALRFDSTAVEVAAIGTRFGITDVPIVLENGRAVFRGFGLIAPNRSRLALDGTVDLSDWRRLTADLQVGATDFRIVDVPRSRGSMLFGKADADLSARVRGPLDALEVRGRVGLLSGTEVTYVMQEGPAGIGERPQTVVRFVSFSDTTTVPAARPPAMLRLGGIDMLMNVAIDPQVQASVYLSEEGKSRIDLSGGGNLTYSMNRLGDMRLAGRYELSGGRVRYSPPLIPTKEFAIEPGGYVSWTGDPADPSFSIGAEQKVRTTVTMEDQTERQVEFRIGIDLSGSLEHMDVRFDLSAPEYLTLQNQLASLTPEQRQDQAMGLLIYNTYSGPGTSARVNTGNPIHSFLAKELNQWAQNSLPGMELTFGVDSYDDPTAGPEGTRTDYSYRLSKRFFDNRMRITVGGKVSSGGETTQSAAENLVGDVSVEYRLTRRDNMYLKVFRKTNFESILEGEVTETGVGFGVRKKVMKLGELFKLTRERPGGAEGLK